MSIIIPTTIRVIGENNNVKPAIIVGKTAPMIPRVARSPAKIPQE